MLTPLLATKLFIPPSRKNLVHRPRLYARLDECLQPDCRLALVSAPAGYGKTTLISGWAAGLMQSAVSPPPCVAWLSISEDDNDLPRFWTYAISAIQVQAKGLGQQSLTLLQAPQPPNPETILSLLINNLTEFTGQLILVLDDFHLIGTPFIYQSLAFLIDHAPPQFHVLILSRTDPPLPLALLRGRGQLLEIRLADLRFSPDEAEAYLNGTMNLALPFSAVERLMAKTEGWATGLQMAAASLQNRPNAEAFIISFSGTNRFILDYLIEEVLNHQPEEIQEFLLQTSVLDNLCGALCDAVLADRPSGSFADSGAILTYLENSNLFTIPLDEERIWYRYHQLFADILKVKLSQKAPEREAVLKRRAAAWFEKNSMLAEAVSYAATAKDYEYIARLLEQNLHSVMQHGQMMPFISWVRYLPDPVIMEHPWMCILSAWWLSSLARYDQVPFFLQRAEELVYQAGPVSDAREMSGIIYALRALVLENQGDLSGVIETAKQALELLDPTVVVTRSPIDYILGRAYYIYGDLAHAEQIWSEFSSRSVQADVSSIYAIVMNARANICIVRGKLGEAIHICRQAIERMTDKGLDGFFMSGGPYVALGFVMILKNELDEAGKLIDESLKQNRRWGNLNSIVTGLTYQARLLIIRGDLRAAEVNLQAEELMFQKFRPYTEIYNHYISCAMRLLLAKGDVSAAEKLIEENGLRKEEQLTFQNLQNQVTVSRVLIARGSFREAEGLLRLIAQNARLGGYFGWLIEIQNLHAVALLALGRTSEALEALAESLELAEPEGYLRPFLDEGQPMVELLNLAVKEHIQPGFSSQLLVAFPAYSPQPLFVIEEKAQGIPDLIEPLSRREIEVLRLIAEGYANKEIALRLSLSVRTVKFYATSIYTKLGVAGRTGAIHKAQSLGLL